MTRYTGRLSEFRVRLLDANPVDDVLETSTRCHYVAIRSVITISEKSLEKISKQNLWKYNNTQKAKVDSTSLSNRKPFGVVNCRSKGNLWLDQRKDGPGTDRRCLNPEGGGGEEDLQEIYSTTYAARSIRYGRDCLQINWYWSVG